MKEINSKELHEINGGGVKEIIGTLFELADKLYKVGQGFARRIREGRKNK